MFKSAAFLVAPEVQDLESDIYVFNVMLSSVSASVRVVPA